VCEEKRVLFMYVLEIADFNSLDEKEEILFESLSVAEDYLDRLLFETVRDRKFILIQELNSGHIRQVGISFKDTNKMELYTIDLKV
jgi:hypothetical protein